MQFIPLENAGQLECIAAANEYQVILKHNTTCSISKGVLDRLKASEVPLPGVQAIHVLDLMNHRDISDAIAQRFQVEHQSPQVLLIKDGKCIYTEWGFDIAAEEVKKAMEK